MEMFTLKGTLEWIGEPFDPAAFDVDQVNARLRRLKLKELAPRAPRRRLV